MTKLLLHIGTGKTGTTSIQRTLSSASRAGVMREVAYPRLRGHNHNFLAALYQPTDQLPRRITARYESDPRSLERDVREFRERLALTLSENESVILSAEYLYVFDDASVRRFRDDLDDFGVDGVRVVAYVRDPASYYLSFVQQTIKASSTFEAPETFRYEFIDVLDRWSAQFPDVVVRPFQTEQLLDGDVVRDFLAVAEDHFGSEVIEPDDLEVRVVNESVSAEAMVVLRRYMQYAEVDPLSWRPDAVRLVGLLEGCDTPFPQTAPRLKDEVAELIMERHLADLRTLRQRFGVDLLGGHVPGRPSPAATPVVPDRADLSEILSEYDERTVQQLLYHLLEQVLRETQGNG